MEITIDVYCCNCGYCSKILVDSDGYNRWQEGKTIGKALPNLTESEKVTLESNLCADCQEGDSFEGEF